MIHKCTKFQIDIFKNKKTNIFVDNNKQLQQNIHKYIELFLRMLDNKYDLNSPDYD